MSFKQEFEQIYNQYVVREGKEKLLEYIQNSDFFTAPASAKYHGNHEGGLVEHCLNVYKRLKSLIVSEFGENYTDHYSDETIAIVALFHDICKVNSYTIDYRNVKENGEWKKVPYYAVKNTFPYGHGEKSVYIVNNFIRLTHEEAMAINWHMGGFDDRVKANAGSVGEAFKAFPLTLFLHIADLSATYIDERE